MSSFDFVVCIMGPSAVGKTALALALADDLPCEIISVDSAMVYRGLDIGTAKPSVRELATVPHHLVDICDPSEVFSAGNFQRQALDLIDSILAKNKIPLLVGGTMLYFRALLQGLSDLPKANPDIRQQISAQAKQQGWQVLHQQLAIIDPESANKIHPNDPQRIQRALEVYQLTGQTLTQLNKNQRYNFPYKVLKLGMNLDRSILHQRVEQRFLQMLTQGLMEEVERLYQRQDLNSELPAIRAVGYRQVWQYLENKINYHTMIEKAVAATRQLVKRQLTWLRAEPDLYCLEASQTDLITEVQQQITTIIK